MARLRVGIIVFSLLSLISAGPALANVSIPSSHVLPDVSYLYISENTTWYAANSPYVFEEDVTVASGVTLTIEPGVVVKFGANRGLDISGTLVADASGGDRISFTSIKDDSVGGDDNNDGGATSPAESDWDAIRFYGGSTGNVLNNVFVGYGGYGNGYNVRSDTTSLTITDSTIAYGPTGIYYDIGSATGAINVSGNDFVDNSGYPVSVYLYNHSADINLSGNTATNNGHNGVKLYGGVAGTVTFDGDPSLPFVIDNYLDISGGASLTLTPGSIVKFISTSGDMDIWGTLVADAGGADRISFTSIKDDSIGGDTNNDGTATSPAVNDWEWIYFHSGSTGNILDNVFVGYGSYGSGYNVRSDTTSLTVTDSTIAYGRTGIHYDIGSATGAINISGNEFLNNSDYPVSVYLYNHAADINLSGNTATNNGRNGVRLNGSVAGTVTFDGDPSLPFVIDYYMDISGGASLTLTPGSIVKFISTAGDMDIWGTLIADAGGSGRISFTSIKDDSIGGDTNNDGNDTSPAVNDWEWIYFHSGSTGNILDNVFVGYGSYGSGYNVRSDTTSLTVTDSTIAYGRTGIHYDIGSAEGAINISGNEFLDNTIYPVAVYLYNHAADINLSGNIATNNGHNGVRLYGSIAGTVTFDGDPSLPFVIDSALDIGTDASLTLAPGAIVKFISTAGDMDVWGTLVADADGGDRIYFTSIKDDSVGGDTNNDGTATSPAVSDWEWIQFHGGSTDNVLDNVFVGYGGYGNGHNIRSDTTSLTVTDSTITYGPTGIYYSIGSATGAINVSSNDFVDNSGYPVSVYLYNHSADINLSGNTATNNGHNGVKLYGNIAGMVTFDGDANLPFVIDSALDINADASLILTAGSIVKFISTSGDMDIWGTLVADAGGSDRIYFTSVKDDSVGGDTNNDGTATSPAVSDWEWIQFHGGSTGNVLDNVFVGYGSYGNGHNIRSDTSSLTITDSSISHGNTGIYVNNASPTINDNIISVNNGKGIDLYNASPDIVGNTITDNDYGIYTRSGSNPVIDNNQIQDNIQYGVYNYDTSITIDARGNWWGDDTGPYDPSDDITTGGWYNPGGLGDRVSDHVDYMPWTTSEVDTTVTSPNGGEIWYDTRDITWTASDSGPLTVKIELYDGSSFTTIADGLSNTGLYSWDTTGVPDGTYRIRITATTGGGAMGFDLSDGWFVVHNIFSVSISASPTSQNTRQNIEAVYTLTVTNEQPVADTFDLSLVNINNASVAELSQSTIAIGAWSSENVTLNVTDETEGTYLVKAVAVSQTNASINDETTTETRVLPAFTISIYSPKTETSIGGELTYDVRLTSYESATDNFTLDVTGIDETWFTLDSQCQLSAGKSVVLPMEISIPAGAATGDFVVTVQTTSSNLGIAREATAPLHVSADPIIFGLTPADNSRTGATDVLFSWQTSVNSTSEVYIRVEGEPDFVLFTGDAGITHSVTVTSLVRNTWYEFYVHSESAYGAADSEIRRIFIDNGITFSQGTYNFTVERDYDQKVSILVYNTDDEAHELLVSVSAPSEDLIIGFVGGGSTDETITINPGGWKYVSLVIHAHDALFEDYNLILELTNLGAEDIHDYADLNIHVHYPHTEFTMEELSTENSMLAKTIRFTNIADPLTDLCISADEDLSDWVTFEPEISHGHMGTGQQTQFVVSPVLSQGYSGVEGNIIAEAAGETVTLPVSFMLPPGQEVYSGHAVSTLTDEPFQLDTDITLDILENVENRLHIRVNFTEFGSTAEWILEVIPDVVYEPTEEELEMGTDIYAPVFQCEETDDFIEVQFEYITTRDISAGGIDLGGAGQSTGSGAPANTGSLSGAKKVIADFKTGKEQFDRFNDLCNRAHQAHSGFVQDAQFYDKTTRLIQDPETRRRTQTFLYYYRIVRGANRAVGDKLPGTAGGIIAQQIGAGFDTLDVGLRIALKHRAQLEEVEALFFSDEHRSANRYCTNRPKVSTGFGLPNWIQPGYVSSDGGYVEARFTHPWSESSYRPHDVDILLNDNVIASISDTIPLGYYVYSLDPSLLNFATTGTATNTITLSTLHLNGGHYVVSSDFRVIIMLTDIVLHVVASSQEEADQYVADMAGVKLVCPDFALYPEDMSLSNLYPENGEEMCINVKLRNLGSLGALFLVQAFDNNQEFWNRRIALSSFDSIDMCIPWTATQGIHTLKVQLNSPGILEESDYGNNEVSQYVYVSPADITPPMITNIRATNVTTDTATIAWYTHEVSDSLVRYGTESGNYAWQQEDEADVKSHYLDLAGLTPDTLYYYVVSSTDPRGNASESEEHTFTTQAVPPPTGEVQGKILLQGRNIYSGAVVSFTAGSNCWEAISNEIGNFSISLPEGIYDVDVTMTGYLPAHVSDFEVIADQLNLLFDIILLAGDIDGDGVVSIDELVEVLSNFSSSEGSSDLNGDGIVDIFDLVLVGMNYEGGG